MATVYLARDLRHDRQVALKVLHEDLGATLGPDRFLTEIKTTARLQHAHILPLIDSGEAAGLLFYVMPYVAGESLRDRLTREKQLPIDDAVLIAREVADALGFAHALGIIHRDIKPENILLQGGHALVADFGIALAVQHAGGQRMTQTGLSLGTPHYMSPEQAMGERTIDARSDIYALGAVMYEMLTGDPPFTGSTVQGIVAKVMTEKPVPPRILRDTVTPGVERAVLRALAKLPADRFASAADFSSALRSDAMTGVTPIEVQPVPRLWKRVNAGLVGLAAIALLVVTAWALTRPSAAALPMVFDAALPDSAAMSSAVNPSSTGFGVPSVNLSISPHGDFVVYPVERGDSTMLWYRSLTDASAHPIPGTAGGSSPRVSPDGTRVAYVAGNRTLLIPIGGGEPRRLMESDPPTTLEWVSPTRLLATTQGFNLHWLDPEVGQVESVVIKEFCFVRWIEQEQRLLCNFNEGTLVLDPKTGESWPVRTRNTDGSPGRPVSGSAFRIVDGRYMIYVSLDGELRAAPYDRRTHLIGRSVSMVTGIKRDALGIAQMDLTPTGMLGYATGSSATLPQLVRLQSGSLPTPLPIERAAFLRFDLSRDGRRLAAVVGMPDQEEIRIYDLRSGRSQTWLRAESITMPLWNPVGDKILVRVTNGARSAIVLGSPNSTIAPDTLFAATAPAATPDPRQYYNENTIDAEGGSGTIAMVRFNPSERPLRFQTLLPDALFAEISPDGKHLAWHGSVSSQLILSSNPPGTQQQQIANGAAEPLWLSSTALLYRSGVTWYVVRLNAASGELTGPPTLWARDARFQDTPGWSNRVSWDGGIIYLQNPEQSDARFLRFMPNFVERMKTAVDEANR